VRNAGPFFRTAILQRDCKRRSDQRKAGRRSGLARLSLGSQFNKQSHLGFPEGTISQLVAYISGNGKQAATAHEYLQPSGRLGASGKSDPKTMLVDGVLWLVDPNDTSP
jgi:hypothetical protein